MEAVEGLWLGGWIPTGGLGAARMSPSTKHILFQVCFGVGAISYF